MLNQNKQVVDIEKYLHNICVYVNSEKKNIENEIRRFWTLNELFVDQKIIKKKKREKSHFLSFDFLSFFFFDFKKWEKIFFICFFNSNCFTLVSYWNFPSWQVLLSEFLQPFEFGKRLKVFHLFSRRFEQLQKFPAPGEIQKKKKTKN